MAKKKSAAEKVAKEETVNLGKQTYFLKPQYDHQDPPTSWDVRIQKEPDDKYGDPLCSVSYYDMRGGYWCITGTYPSDFSEDVRYATFPDRNMAISFYYLLRTRVEATAKAHPLPDDVNRYLERRAGQLREELKAAVSVFHRIRQEQWQLNKFASEYGIQRVEWQTDDASPESAARKLLETTFTFPNPTKTPEETDFSADFMPDGQDGPWVEANLINMIYALGGKEQGRTIRALLENVLTHLDPSLVSEL